MRKALALCRLVWHAFFLLRMLTSWHLEFRHVGLKTLLLQCNEQPRAGGGSLLFKFLMRKMETYALGALPARVNVSARRGRSMREPARPPLPQKEHTLHKLNAQGQHHPHTPKAEAPETLIRGSRASVVGP